MREVSEAEIAALRNSGQFDAQWYLEQYPDVQMVGMDPAEHYVWVGKKLGRKINASGLKAPSATHESIDKYISDQKEDVFERLQPLGGSTCDLIGPKISILMPVYKTPVTFLDRAIRSVIMQEYQNWEFCIADDGSFDHDITSLLKRYENTESRVKILNLDRNVGISAATNRALEEASGEYIALLDHDDMLTRDALLENVISIIKNENDVDFLYSDECKIDIYDNPLDIFQKPDWSPHLLFNSMYTGHFSLYRKSLVHLVGGFRSKYDFSQDYDLALRVAENTDKIVHVPKVLYGWRTIEGSAASGDKDYARKSNIAALEDAICRRGLGGRAIALPTANRVYRRDVIGQPVVSIIIPSDNIENITSSVNSIHEFTDYKNYEIIVVTNSGIAHALENAFEREVKFTIYDRKFNFSDKCNRGAAEAKGEYFLFFNDDVRSIEQDWLNNILECATLEGVGIVGPKLLYEDDTIQHAGMVTGVRGLVGTAFHCLNKSTHHHYNFVHSVRDVSLICGACLMIRRDVFESIDGWDIDHFSIAHSDVDLCLKVRELGLHCLYTPYASLKHIGHVSIGEVEKKSKTLKKDKADIALLRKWPRETARDPFWTEPMRRALYHDSQEYYKIFPGQTKELGEGRDILLISHELSRSGAPRVLKEMAHILSEAGYFVVVMSPEDGPLRCELEQIGITVIVDELVFSGHESVEKFAKNFDAVIANTVVAWPLVRQISSLVPTFWYLHEGEFMRAVFEAEAGALDALKSATEVWAISHIPEKIVLDFGGSGKVIPWGIPIEPKDIDQEYSQDSISIVVLGSIESRKGQDIALDAFKFMDSNIRGKCKLSFYGRVLDNGYFEELKKNSQSMDDVFVGTELDHVAARRVISAADIILIPSRDEPLSLVAVEGMAEGRIVVCSRAAGIAEFLVDGTSGFIAPDPSPERLAAGMMRAIQSRSRWPEIGSAARQTFEEEFTLDAFAHRLIGRLEADIPNAA